MLNINLAVDKCWKCGAKLEHDVWHTLGRSCSNCRRYKSFTPDLVELAVNNKVVSRTPWSGEIVHLDFTGTNVQVNGEVGVVSRTSGSDSLVQFADHEELIRGLAYDDLLRLFFLSSDKIIVFKGKTGVIVHRFCSAGGEDLFSFIAIDKDGNATRIDEDDKYPISFSEISLYEGKVSKNLRKSVEAIVVANCS